VASKAPARFPCLLSRKVLTVQFGFKLATHARVTHSSLALPFWPDRTQNVPACTQKIMCMPIFSACALRSVCVLENARKSARNTCVHLAILHISARRQHVAARTSNCKRALILAVIFASVQRPLNEWAREK